MLDDLKKEQSAVCENQEVQPLSDTEMDDVSGGFNYEVSWQILGTCITCSYQKKKYKDIREIKSQLQKGQVCRGCPSLEKFNQLAKSSGVRSFIER